MSEFFQAILSPVNLFMTVLLIGCMGYWGLVIFGALAPDAFDFDLDFDGDADLDLDVDSGGGGGTTGGAGGFTGMALIKFFNVGEVPLMVLVSVFVGILWFVGISLHPWLGGWAMILQLLILIPLGMGTLLLTKIITQPLRHIFSKLREEEHAAPRQFLGERCTIVSATADHKHGQAEFDTGGSPLRLNVKTASQHETLTRGSEAVIVADRDKKGVYTIRAF